MNISKAEAKKLLSRRVRKPWSEAEIIVLRVAYQSESAEMLDLDGLALKLGRHKTSVCSKAREIGLTDPSRKKVVQPKGKPRRFVSAEELRAWQSEEASRRIAENGHPRGMLGKKHTEETLALLREANAKPRNLSDEQRQARAARMHARHIAGVGVSDYFRCSGGRRPDLNGIYFRSSWEANYARYLVFLLSRGDIRSWEYEPKTFIFEGITRGTMSYTPDFRVTFNDGHQEWHEVKGWMDQKSRTRLDRMAKLFPSEPVTVIGTEWFRQASQVLPGLIPHWESRRNRDGIRQLRLPSQ